MIANVVQLVAQVLVALFSIAWACMFYRSFVITVRRVDELERRVRRLENRRMR